MRYLHPRGAPDVIHADNLAQLQSRLVAQGANIPCSMESEQVLAARGLLVLPISSPMAAA